MNDDVNWNLLAKHLFGECPEEEAVRLQSWIEGDPARKTLLEELRQVRGLTGSASPEDEETWDTDRLWERVREETAPERASAEGASPDGRAAGRLPDAVGSDIAESEDRPAKDQPAPLPERAARRKSPLRARRSSRGILSSRRARPVLRRAAVGAAVLLVAAALAVLWTRGLQEAGSEGASAPEAKTFATQEGQRAVIRLTDGTRVHLNVDSRLVRPASFGEGRRMVRLEGEAFFEVARDRARPFIVHAGGATTRVLGTAFDVSAYPDAEGTQVVVKEGRVVARSAGQEPAAGQEEDVVLRGGQMGQFLRSGEQVVRKGIDARRYVAWMEGELVFEDAPFERVVRKLERWYDLTVTLSGTSGTPPRGHLNARFAEGEPLEEVLSVVATAFGLEQERRGGRVTFVRKAPRSP